MKRIYNGEAELNAIAILLELSKTEALVEKIGNTKDCIPLLVYLVSYPNPEIALKAQDVLLNLSSNTHFVVKMAESGFFQSFIARFNQGENNDSKVDKSWEKYIGGLLVGVKLYFVLSTQKNRYSSRLTLDE